MGKRGEDKKNTHVECQPCDNFTQSDVDALPYGGHSTHSCPDCEDYDVRRLCSNCNRYHHKNGWCSCYLKQIRRLKKHLRIAIGALNIYADKHLYQMTHDSVAMSTETAQRALAQIQVDYGTKRRNRYEDFSTTDADKNGEPGSNRFNFYVEAARYWHNEADNLRAKLKIAIEVLESVEGFDGSDDILIANAIKQIGKVDK